MYHVNFSNLEGNPDNLELGSEVEYTLGRVTGSGGGRVNGSGGGCASAEYVRVLPRGTVCVAKPLDASINGTVTRTLRALNPDQAQYCGKYTTLQTILNIFTPIRNSFLLAEEINYRSISIGFFSSQKNICSGYSVLVDAPTLKGIST